MPPFILVFILSLLGNAYSLKVDLEYSAKEKENHTTVHLKGEPGEPALVEDYLSYIKQFNDFCLDAQSEYNDNVSYVFDNGNIVLKYKRANGEFITTCNREDFIEKYEDGTQFSGITVKFKMGAKQSPFETRFDLVCLVDPFGPKVSAHCTYNMVKYDDEWYPLMRPRTIRILQERHIRWFRKQHLMQNGSTPAEDSKNAIFGRKCREITLSSGIMKKHYDEVLAPFDDFATRQMHQNDEQRTCIDSFDTDKWTLTNYTRMDDVISSMVIMLFVKKDTVTTEDRIPHYLAVSCRQRRDQLERWVNCAFEKGLFAEKEQIFSYGVPPKYRIDLAPIDLTQFAHIDWKALERYMMGPRDSPARGFP